MSYQNDICAICLNQLHSSQHLEDGLIESTDSEEIFDTISLGSSSSELWECEGCNSSFHQDCIDTWKSNSRTYTCPTCRKTYVNSSFRVKKTVFKSIMCIKVSTSACLITCFILFLVSLVHFSYYFENLINYDNKNRTI